MLVGDLEDDVSTVVNRTLRKHPSTKSSEEQRGIEHASVSLLNVGKLQRLYTTFSIFYEAEPLDPAAQVRLCREMLIELIPLRLSRMMRKPSHKATFLAYAASQGSTSMSERGSWN
ncbi:uncharacterized protein LOC127247999 [Andrographis paniculata]|uniref:uncharacterized protein LOC127247999 n=1 Tax=Andrographis paniculata TaxID=175694 RepID=UPI0021E77992|nr:uncharacterized protein LOC127247999 [Andrographis paniculata]